jgi:hypothetical protein
MRQGPVNLKKQIKNVTYCCDTYEWILLIGNCGFFLVFVKFNSLLRIILEFHSSKLGKLRDECSLSDGLVCLENVGIFIFNNGRKFEMPDKFFFFLPET